uniref:Uncharacterized protein n=1 Tax=Romanomermis culicivorax TaxID=13658 RepID=A0A915HND9_ROMCU
MDNIMKPVGRGQPFYKSMDNWQLHALPNGSIDVSNSTHLQLTSATPHTIDITPRANMHRKITEPSTTHHQKITEPLTTHHHLYLDI